MFHRVLNTSLKPYDLVKAIFLCFTTHKFVRFSWLLLNFKYCIVFSDYSQKICSLISRCRAKLRRRYFRFLDFWSISYKKNCHNPRTSDDFDMKFGAATKLCKRNKTSRRRICFPIYGQFGEIRKPDSGRIICKPYIFTSLLSYKNWKQN